MESRREGAPVRGAAQIGASVVGPCFLQLGGQVEGGVKLTGESEVRTDELPVAIGARHPVDHAVPFNAGNVGRVAVRPASA